MATTSPSPDRSPTPSSARPPARPPSQSPAQSLALVRHAALAPSSHNTQPWRFRIAAGGIDLFADRTRALPVNDPHDRELTISCACALLNLRVAAAHEGLAPQVELLPRSDEPDLLARITLRPAADAAPREGALLGAIARRRTWRRPFADRAVDPAVTRLLVDDARAEGAWLRPLETDEARERAAQLVAAGDAAQWADPAWRRELAEWMHPRRRGDGLAVPALAAPVAQFVVRSVNLGGGVSAKDRELAASAPLLAVLGTDGDTPRDWLRAGLALERVLLLACELGLQASYLNQPIQVEALRPRLGALAGGGFPQLLLRIGHADDELPPAPRRAVEEILAPA